MRYEELSPQIQQNLRFGYTLVEHAYVTGEFHISTAMLGVTHGIDKTGALMTQHFCHDDSCQDIFPAAEFMVLEVEGVPRRETKHPGSEQNGIHPTFDAAALAEVLEIAAQAGAEELAVVNAQTLAALQAKIRTLYAEVVGNRDGMAQNLLAHLMFIAENGGQDPSENPAVFDEFCNELDNEFGR